MKGVDGIKTGYTRASGFNLVTSVERGNRKIVAVVIGGETGGARDKLMAQLIDKYIGRASTNTKRVASIPGKVSVQVAVRHAPTRPCRRLRPTVDDGDDDDASIAVAAQPDGAGSRGRQRQAAHDRLADRGRQLDLRARPDDRHGRRRRRHRRRSRRRRRAGVGAGRTAGASRSRPRPPRRRPKTFSIARSPRPRRFSPTLRPTPNRWKAAAPRSTAPASPASPARTTRGSACAYLEKQKFSCLAVSD